MSQRHTIQVLPATSRVRQTPASTSFVGGRPKIPLDAELPTCRLCGAVQTFFLQVAFPETHEWAGQSLAVFQCTSCHDERFLVPLMSREPLLPGQDIPDGILEDDQTNYRLLAFPTASGSSRDDSEERVGFRPIVLAATGGRSETRSRVGGRPHWVHGNMAPGRYRGRPLTFLMQWETGFDFRVIPGSPRQAAPPLALGLDPPPETYYNLFLGCELYLFGNRDGDIAHLYVCPQTP